jgi:predicted amidohydrolase
MLTKVCAISPTNEKTWVDGKLVYFYALATSTREEVDATVTFYLDKCERLLRRAAQDGARLAVLPENTIEINKWLKVQPRAEAMAVMRWMNAQVHERIAPLARELGLVTVICCDEVVGDRVYNAALVFDADGSYRGSYHKVQLTPPEKEWITPGEALPVFPTAVGKLGIFICWDIIFPEVTQTLMLNGAELLVQPTYGHAGPQADAMAQIRAHDAVCPLLVSMWNGASRIFDRDGTMLARAHRTRDWENLIPDQLTIAEVDPQAKRQWIIYDDLRPNLIAQRRTDLFGPLVAPRS